MTDRCSSFRRGGRLLALAAAAMALAPALADGAVTVTVVPAGKASARGARVTATGLAARVRGSVGVAGGHGRTFRAGRHGRVRVRVVLPRIRKRAARIVVRAGARRVVVPAAARRSAPARRGRPRLALTPYRAVPGAPRTLRGWGWPHRKALTASIAGTAIASARTGRHGRFAIGLAPGAPPRGRLVV